ncbi:acyl-CoA N-acyltransferase [Laetiporus sulphureus 93-53]|uniref:Acyl-CoA N-acyltransferase n=1 Tax=Laetiporus sulphureus 93-53 TaxID=1314785 RepID=A0A165F3Z0_9APHY|nr:acyl-CoA N-acyltransferase [Laetiporus sulphureus 93-53]KZT08335.1 acyl-CoA N-acyltransferase [Laetiporus sulphureus 93-53]
MSSSLSRSSTQSRVSLSSLTPNNLGTVRKLNSVLFPIKYSEKFYQDIILPEAEDFCKLIYYNDIPVGTICCRLETVDGQTRLYLMTMGVLAPYRSRGLGSFSLQQIIDAAAAHTKPKISAIYLHVQVSNIVAKQFYERHGFKETGVHEGYYKKIVPHDAWILERELSSDARDAEKSGENTGATICSP